MSPPSVSVIMSVYNEEDYLKETIDSILSQTFLDFEFIIINDGSTDSTQEILDSYGETDSRIRLFANIENSGIARASNLAIEKAKGGYIAIMDAGDIALNNRLERQVAFLNTHNDTYILGTQCQWIDEKKQIIGACKMPLKVTDRLLYKTGGAIHPSVMMRRKLFKIIGPYDSHLVMSQEFDLYMRALKKGLGIANLEDFLVLVMQRKEGMTLTHLKTIQKNQLKIKAKYLSSFFSLWNIIYTIRSLFGYIIPQFILIMIVRLLRRERCQ